ncbi:hypothetical protein SLS59_009181 [Nothophoma quercina]|uniref:Uncharacterized protein n=1 Tax=Nothophoma quercina TaxID=749835 RepID=A0ABR3QPE0_9PLEO
MASPPALRLRPVQKPDKYPLTQEDIVRSGPMTHELFGLKLFQHYVGWQSSIFGYGGAQFPAHAAYRQRLLETCNSNLVGLVPSVEHYKCFTDYMFAGKGANILFPRRQQPNVSSGVSASAQTRPSALLCGHRLHPSNNINFSKACPCCLLLEINAALARIDKVWHAFENKGSQKRVYRHFQRIWNAQKQQWRLLVDKMELAAEQERRWEFEQLDKGREIEELTACTMSCADLLRVMDFTPCMVSGWNLSFISKRMRRLEVRRPPVSPAAKRQDTGRVMYSTEYTFVPSLAFKGSRHSWASQYPVVGKIHGYTTSTECRSRSDSPDTITSSPSPSTSHAVRLPRKKTSFAPTIMENEPRPRLSFNRRSDTYAPGRWACREGYEWVDSYTRYKLGPTSSEHVWEEEEDQEWWTPHSVVEDGDDYDWIADEDLDDEFWNEENLDDEVFDDEEEEPLSPEGSQTLQPDFNLAAFEPVILSIEGENGFEVGAISQALLDIRSLDVPDFSIDAFGANLNVPKIDDDSCVVYGESGVKRRRLN